MPETENETPEDQTNSEGEEIQLLDCQQLSKPLSEEKLVSVNLLNDSTKHLIMLAKSATSLMRVDDETGEVLIRPAAQDIDVAIKALSEARNIMKIKLDYLKFGKELITDMME